MRVLSSVFMSDGLIPASRAEPLPLAVEPSGISSLQGFVLGSDHIASLHCEDSERPLGDASSSSMSAALGTASKELLQPHDACMVSIFQSIRTRCDGLHGRSWPWRSFQMFLVVSTRPSPRQLCSLQKLTGTAKHRSLASFRTKTQQQH